MKRSFAAMLFGIVIIYSTHAHACKSGAYSWGDEWPRWDFTRHAFYLIGYNEGAKRVALDLAKSWPDGLPEKKSEQQTLLARAGFPPGADASLISDEITKLYADPANTYIALSAMVNIACDKFRGKDVGAQLKAAREKDCEYPVPG